MALPHERSTTGARSATDGGAHFGASKRIRVDILFGLAYPDARVRRTAQALAGAGYDVRVLAWDRSGRLPARNRDGQVRIEHAGVASRSGRGAAQIAFLGRALWRHLPRLRADPPDVIHAVDLPMLAAALALRRLMRTRPRVVYDAFEIYALMEAHKYPGWLLRGIEAAERRLPGRADLVITPGDGRRAYFARRGIDSVVVGNWMDPPKTPHDRTAARRSQSAEDRFTVVYAGGLEPSRDLDTLLGHARRVPDDLVLIAGRGEQEAEVRRAAVELPNVRFLGWVAEPDVLYAAADAVYYALRPGHPYAAHPAPNNLYAAIAHAVPIVHRGQGELAAVAAEADIGASFTDGASLDRALASLRDPDRQRAVRASLRGLQERYSATAAARILVEAYGRLMA